MDLDAFILDLVHRFPRLFGGLGIALFCVLALHGATAHVDVERLKLTWPRIAGFVLVIRGVAPVARWIFRGLLLILNPALEQRVFPGDNPPPGGAT